MVGGMLRGQHLPAAVLEQIVAKTDGIPLFVEEVTKAVLEAGGYGDVQEQDVAIRCRRWPFPPRYTRRCWLGSIGWGAAAWRNWSYLGASSLCPAAGCRTTGDGPLQRDLAALVTAECCCINAAAPAGRIRIQACPDPGSCLRIGAATRAPADPPAPRPGAGGTVSEMAATQPELLAHHALRGELREGRGLFHQAGAQALARSANREAMTSFEQALKPCNTSPTATTHACRPSIFASLCAMRSGPG